MGWRDQPEVATEAPAAATPAVITPRMAQQPVFREAPPPERPAFDAADVGRGALSGLVKGASGFADTILTGGRPRFDEPAPIPEGTDLSSYKPSFAFKEPMTPVVSAAKSAMPDQMGYEPTSTAGGYAQNIAEFAPGMLFPAGKAGMVPRLINNVVAPAVTSETTGLAARKLFPDSDSAEAWARLAGSFMGAPVGKTLEAGYRAAKPAATTDNLNAILSRNNISTTAGNVTGDKRLLSREAAAPRTAEIIQNQPAQLRKATFKAAGVNLPDDVRGLDEVMSVVEQARKKSGQTYNQVTQGLKMVPSRLHASKMRSIADTYATGVESGLQTGTVKQIQNAVENSFKSGKPIPPDQIGKWRSAISAATVSASPVARQSAIETLRVLDDVIGRSLAQAGRQKDIPLLSKARAQYRDILAIEGALLKSGKVGDKGFFTPEALASSLSNQGKTSFMRGRRGELANIARAGRSVLTPIEKIPAVKPSRAGTALGIGADAAATYAGFQLGNKMFPDNPYLAGAIGTGAGAATEMGRRAFGSALNSAYGSKIAQEAMKRAAANPASGSTGLMGGPVGLSTGATDAPREGRKAGGRVSSHDAAADQLVRAAEHAKKGWSAETAPLLNHSDETVVKALEVANRSI